MTLAPAERDIGVSEEGEHEAAMSREWEMMEGEDEDASRPPLDTEMEQAARESFENEVEGGDKGKGRAVEVEDEREIPSGSRPLPDEPRAPPRRVLVSRKTPGPWPPHLSDSYLAELLKTMQDAADAYTAHQSLSTHPPFYAAHLINPPSSLETAGPPMDRASSPPALVLIRDERMMRRAHVEKADLLWIEYCEAREKYARCARMREIATLPDDVIFNLHRAFNDNLVQGPPFDGRSRLGTRRQRAASGGL